MELRFKHSRLQRSSKYCYTGIRDWEDYGVTGYLVGLTSEPVWCNTLSGALQNPKDKYIGNPGGQSWTVEWLKFDNSYFKVSST